MVEVVSSTSTGSSDAAGLQAATSTETRKVSRIVRFIVRSLFLLYWSFSVAKAIMMLHDVRS